jgi:phosphatidylinositol glycan class B
MSVSTLTAYGSTRRPAVAMAAPSATAVAVFAITILAVGLRLVPLLLEPSMNWPDEVFQAMEPAHRLVYGTGLIPWEFQLKVRSWLLPGFIAGLMETARVIGDGPDIYLPVVAGTFALIGATPAIVCFFWCRRLFGLTGAIIGGIVVATTPDLMYFGARTLTEVVAGNVFVVPIYLASVEGRAASKQKAALIGLLLGIVCVLRIQIAPAAAVVGLYALWRMPSSSRVWLIAGGLAVLVGAALLDAVTLGAPLASIWRYVLYNVGYGVSDLFGVEPWDFYFWAELWIWGLAAVLLVPIVVKGSAAAPMPLAMAVVIVGVHSAIAHKEVRFVYPAIVLLSTLGGVGLAGITRAVSDRLSHRRVTRRTVSGLCAAAATGIWVAVAAFVWFGSSMTALRSLGSDNLAAAAFLHRASGICGIGVVEGDHYFWSTSGGYTYIHRSVPIYRIKAGSAARTYASAVNWLIYKQAIPLDVGFTMDRCFGSVCVAQRQGVCSPAAPTPIPLPAPLARIAHGIAERAVK